MHRLRSSQTRNVKSAIERGESSPRLAGSGPLEIGFGPAADWRLHVVLGFGLGSTSEKQNASNHVSLARDRVIEYVNRLTTHTSMAIRCNMGAIAFGDEKSSIFLARTQLS
jgi:hypothetical protein